MSKVAIITDLHLWFTLENARGKIGINTHGLESCKYLDELVIALNKCNPDIIINLWDIIDGRFLWDKKKLLQEYVSKIDERRYHALWNHDQALLWIELFEKTFWSKRHMIELEDSVHIILDVYKDKSVDEIYIAGDTTIFLEDFLAKYANKRLYVYSHYPINRNKENITYYHKWNPQKTFIKQWREICKMLERFWVKMFISWHTHMSFLKEIEWVKHATIASFSEDIWNRPWLSYVILDTDTDILIQGDLYTD